MHFDFLTVAGLFASVARRQALDPDFPMNMNSSTCALALGFNQLTGEIPAKIGQMTSLKTGPLCESADRSNPNRTVAAE
jgi:hypothetical protein